MQVSWRTLYREWTRLVSSFFYLGLLPWCPGTWGSLGGLALAWWLHPVLFYLFFFLTVLGLSVCKSSEVLYGRKDPPSFVMDEVCGVLLSVLCLPKDLWVYLGALALFRILDTQKPWFIRRFQNRVHPHNIMWDDLAAGFLTNLTIQFLTRVIF